MHDISCKKWQEFPYELSAQVIKVIKLSERMLKKAHGDQNVSSWHSINTAATAVREHGMPRINELLEALAPRSDSHDAVLNLMALDDILTRWSKNPGMPAPEVKEPGLKRRVQGLKTPRERRSSERKPGLHAAPAEWWMSGHAWLGFRYHDLFWDAESAVIIDDPGTHEMCGLISGGGRRVYTVKYGDGVSIRLADGKLRSLKTVPDGSCEPAAVLLCSCQTFNIKRELFSNIADVHETVIRLGRTGLIGPGTVKFGVGYVGNGEYVRDYLNVRDFIFRADFMLTEYVDDWEGYELKRKKNEPEALELF